MPRFPAATPSPPTRCSTILRGAASRPTCCRGAATRAHSDHGLFADRAGPALARPRACPRGLRHRATPAQVALAWVLRHKDMMVIPKATTLAHVRENRAAVDLALTQEDLAELDSAFPTPRGRRHWKCCESGRRLRSRDGFADHGLTLNASSASLRAWTVFFGQSDGLIRLACLPGVFLLMAAIELYCRSDAQRLQGAALAHQSRHRRRRYFWCCG